MSYVVYLIIFQLRSVETSEFSVILQICWLYFNSRLQKYRLLFNRNVTYSEGRIINKFNESHIKSCAVSSMYITVRIHPRFFQEFRKSPMVDIQNTTENTMFQSLGRRRLPSCCRRVRAVWASTSPRPILSSSMTRTGTHITTFR